MDRERVIALLRDDWGKMTGLVRSTLSSDVQLLQSINDSLLNNGGKMLRPLLTMLVAKTCTCDGPLGEDSIRSAAGVEILHNATLLHDDVADNAGTRRGTPTVMSAWGAVPAVLVGDFWLARAVSLLSNSADINWTIGEFARTLTDLAEGEMLQQQKAFSSDTTVEDYLRIIFCKTASLFVTACETGAKTVKAPEAYMKAAGDYGRALGMAFQIRDDILDYAGDERTGKPVGIDLQEQKITLPLLGALLQSPSEEAVIRAMIHAIPAHPEYCMRIRQIVLDAGGVEYANGKLNEYVDAALRALEAFPESESRALLADIARESAVRKK